MSSSNEPQGAAANERRREGNERTTRRAWYRAISIDLDQRIMRQQACSLVDVSAGGCAMIVAEPVEAGQMILIVKLDPIAGEERRYYGEVRHAETRHDGWTHAGIQFHTLPDSLRDLDLGMEPGHPSIAA